VNSLFCTSAIGLNSKTWIIPQEQGSGSGCVCIGGGGGGDGGGCDFTPGGSPI